MIVQSDSPDKRRAILKSALELIKDNGFHGTPISLIAKSACVATGTIYHYFPTKDAIIMELYHQVKKEMAEAMFRDGDTKKEYKEQFFEGWINLCKYFINNPGSLIFIEQFNSSPFAKMAVLEEVKGAVSKFNEFFQLGMDKGYIKKMEYLLIASAVFGCITATAKYHVSGRFGFKDADLCKIANILWDGIKIQ
jgi:TetR/AcrR family transcriptional repressor of multidrug resistance operon